MLVRTGATRQWLLIKHRDAWAGEVDVTTAAPLSIKSFGDFADIMAAEKPEIWQSHMPAKGGAAGEMLRGIIEQAAKKIAAREAQRPGTKRQSRAGTTRKAKPARARS